MSIGPVLRWPDYVVIGLTLIISVVLGLIPACTGGRQKTTSEYLTADRGLHLFPVALSLLVTYMSGITLLGIATEVYYFGIQFWFWMFGHIFGAIFTMVLYVPLLYPLGINSTNQYLLMRYESKVVALIGTFLQVVDLVFLNAFVIYAPALFFRTASSFPIWASILVMGTVSTFYTALGGLKAVIWTDVFQASIMLIGLLAVIIQGTIRLGGVAQTWSNYKAGGRLYVDFVPSLFTRVNVWSVGIGQSFSWTINYGILQMGLQRYSALPTYKKAIQSIALLIPMNLIIQSMCAVVGVIAFAYYFGVGCDPYASGAIGNINQIVPYMVLDILLTPGLPGIVYAAIFAGALSNVSSSLTGLATFTWEDILKERFASLPEHKKTWITKGLVVLYGMVSTGLAFVVLHIGGTLIQMVTRVHNILIIPIGILFTLGAGWPWTNAKSGLVASLLSMGMVTWMSVGNILYRVHQSPLATNIDNCSAVSTNGSTTIYSATPRAETTPLSETTDGALTSALLTFYNISYLWYDLLALSVGLMAGILITFIPGCHRKRGLEERLIFPTMRRCWRNILQTDDSEKDPDEGADDVSDDVTVSDVWTVPSRTKDDGIYVTQF